MNRHAAGRGHKRFFNLIMKECPISRECGESALPVGPFGTIE